MKVEAVMLANEAQVVDGLLHVNGGGWEQYVLNPIPNTLAGVMCGVVTIEDGDDGAEIQFSIDDEGGQLSGSSGSTTVTALNGPRKDGATSRAPFVWAFSTGAHGATVARARITSANEVLAEIRFGVVGTVPDDLSGLD